MYGQSCRVVASGGVGPLWSGGTSLCWGRSVTFHSHRSMGIPQVRWVHLARQYIALPRPWLPLLMESRVSRDLLSHVPQNMGVVRLVLPGVRVHAWVVFGGGVVGREEGVGAVHHPVASCCVLVGGGEGVVQVGHEGHVRGAGWLPVVGGGDIPQDVVPEGAQAGHPGYPCFPLPLFHVAGGGAGWGVGDVGLALTGAALGVLPLWHAVSD